MGRPATTSATPAPASSDGFNSSVSRDPTALIITGSPGMPSVVQCTLGTTALTFASVATDDADGNKVTTDNCGVSKNYEQVTKYIDVEAVNISQKEKFPQFTHFG